MAAAVGPDGTIFVAGAIYSTAGENSFFVAKLHSDDGRLVWNFQVRGPVVPRAVAVLTDGSVAVAGAYTATLDFDPSPRSDIHPAGPTPATFVTRLMPDGAYAWTRTLMDQPDGQAVVAATPDGGLVLGGLFWDRADLDPTEGVDMHVSANGRDAPYVVKLSADGSYLWGRTFDESDQKPSLQRLAVDGAGNLAVAISLVGTMDVDPGPAVRMIPARPEAPWHVVVGLDGGGQHKWSHVFGIATDLTLPPLQLAFASDGDLVVAGAFRGRADFDATGAHRWVTAPSGASPVFLTRLAGDTGAQRFNGVMTTLGSSRAASLVPAPGAGVVAGIEHDRAIDIDPGQGTITRANAGTSPSFLLVQLSSVGGYVSDTPIPLNGGALAAAGDAQLVVVHLRADSVQEISKYAPRRP